MVKRFLRSVVVGAALLAVLCAPAAAGGSSVPPRPDWCKAGGCTLGCYLPLRGMTSNVQACRAAGLPLVWFGSPRR